MSGQKREAEKFGEQAKRIKEKSLQPDHLSVAFTNKGLGFAQLKAGKLDEAYGTLDEAIEVFEKNYAPDDPILQETKKARDSINF
jgi:tetratricopeptide (TPR) repeat protein